MNQDLLKKQEDLALKRYLTQKKSVESRERALSAGQIDKVESTERLLKRAIIAGSEKMLSKVASGPMTRKDYESLIGVNELMPASFLTVGAQRRRTVGRIAIRESNGVGYGTGFLIGPGLIMTNHHVLEDETVAERGVIQFDYAEDFPSPGGVAFQLKPDLFFIADEKLDFAVCGVAAVSQTGDSVASRGWNRLIAESGKAIFGEDLYIIQHPGARRQEVSLRGNQFKGVFDDFVYYENDTERGSSGSPVFNRQWQLASLHHAGISSRATADGRNANEGIRISSIVTAVRAELRGKPAAWAALFERGFEEPPAEAFHTTSQMIAARREEELPSVVVDQHGTLHCNLPLRLSLGWNLPGLIERIAPAGIVAASAAAAPTVLRSRSKDSLRKQAERIFEDFKSKPYLDPEDKNKKRDYYAGLNMDQDEGANYEALSDLISNARRFKAQGYRNARLKHLYPWVDLHESGGERFLCSIYSGEQMDAVDAIEEDLKLEAMQIGGDYESLSGAEIEERLEKLELLEDFESAGAYNCEHVVPQSWFLKHEPMRGDLHHLFACESDCNSFRGNICYWTFQEEAFREKCGRLDKKNNRFEPVEGKGAVARATLYFLLRYREKFEVNGKDLNGDRIRMLLDWHAAFKPSDYEIHRNAAIADIQGNRNPLIDHPEWAERIDFGRR